MLIQKLVARLMAATVVTGALCSATLPLQAQAGAAHQKPSQPNFVWLLSEDNYKGFLRLYNPNGAEMPNVEAMAENGLVFNNAFTNGPVCSTARSTLAVGAYASRLGLNYHRRAKYVRLPDSVKAISQLMKEGGYYTANNLKEDYNFGQPNGSVWNASKKGASWRQRKPGQPFFYMQSWGTTHEIKLHFPLSDVKEKKTDHDPDKVELFPTYPNTEIFRYTHARYLDAHVQLDQQIGEVIDQLKVDGELENTFIFYFGDNGGVMPGSKGYPFEVGLNVPLVIRIPENFRHLLNPEMQKLRNARIDGFVNFIDFAPTLLKLAGLPSQPQQDGHPFLGSDVSLKELNKRDFAFGYADRFDEKSDMVRTIRKGNLKYFRYFEPFNPNALFNEYRYKQQAYKEWKELYKQHALTEEQSAFFKASPMEALYDISVDPFELNNLAEKPEYQKVLKGMRQQMIDHLKSLPDLSFFPESHLVAEAFDAPLQFGQQHKSEIASLIDLASLPLQGFEKAKGKLKKALTSMSPWKRQWALIGLTTLGQESAEMSAIVKEIMKSDEVAVNRGRAIQYLAMTKQMNPKAAMEKLVAATEDDVEALELLNMAAQLHDVMGYTFDIELKEGWKKPNKKGMPYLQYQKLKNKSYWLGARVNYLKQP